MAIVIPRNGYCAVSDVEGFIHNPATFDATSVPKLTQVESWITFYYNRLNSILYRAGYVTPVVTTGSLLAVSGTLQTRSAHQVHDTILKLSATSISGRVSPGDLFLISGDSQYYVAMSGMRAPQGATQIDIEIDPPTLEAYTAGTTVQHFPTTNAAENLKELNALMVAARVATQQPSDGGDEENDFGKNLTEEANEKLDMLKNGQMPLVGAKKRRRATPPGAVRTEVRG